MSEVKVNKISPRTNCGTVTVGDSGDSVSVTAGVPVTVNGDLKSNALKAVDGGSIISQCGTNITLGASGDTINLAAGASQTGFGRTGTVDWDTTPKTASFTAVSGDGYFINSSSAITMTLPAGSAGAIVSVSDYSRNFATYNLTISPNGSEKIGGIAQNAVLDIDGQAATFVYVDATKGWVNVQNAEDTETGQVPTFISATGGTITTCGDFKIHTFNSPGTFTVCSVGNAAGSNTVSYMIVAGGAGTSNAARCQWAGGGGAGGFREGKAASDCYSASPLATTGLSVTATGFPITVGGGGGANSNGSNSSFSTITSAGGGTGGAYITIGTNGGSGGGGGGDQTRAGGSGNTPPVSPPQGQDGGIGKDLAPEGGGGGGGAGAVGGDGLPGGAGVGGDGAPTFINPSPSNGTSGPGPGRYFAGGGGGGSGRADLCGPATSSGGAGGGGAGGGGDNSPTPLACGTNGVANTGGGGGGVGGTSGGSGIVIIRYKYQ